MHVICFRAEQFRCVGRPLNLRRFSACGMLPALMSAVFHRQSTPKFVDVGACVLRMYMIESSKQFRSCAPDGCTGQNTSTCREGRLCREYLQYYVIGLCAVLSVTKTTTAQTTNATIVGDVTDPGGGRIAGADIQVRNAATGVSS